MDIYFCLCILAGEQWTPRAAGNQPWGFHDSEERRRIGEHVAVAVANQHWCQLAEKLESPWWLPTFPFLPLPLPLLCTVCTVCCNFTQQIFPMILSLLLDHLQHDAPKLHPCLVIQKKAAHTHIFFIFFFFVGTSVIWLILPTCMSLWCLHSFNVWMGKRRAWVKINL